MNEGERNQNEENRKISENKNEEQNPQQILYDYNSSNNDVKNQPQDDPEDKNTIRTSMEQTIPPDAQNLVLKAMSDINVPPELIDYELGKPFGQNIEEIALTTLQNNGIPVDQLEKLKGSTSQETLTNIGTALGIGAGAGAGIGLGLMIGGEIKGTELVIPSEYVTGTVGDKGVIIETRIDSTGTNIQFVTSDGNKFSAEINQDLGNGSQVSGTVESTIQGDISGSVSYSQEKGNVTVSASKENIAIEGQLQLTPQEFISATLNAPFGNNEAEFNINYSNDNSGLKIAVNYNEEQGLDVSGQGAIYNNTKTGASISGVAGINMNNGTTSASAGAEFSQDFGEYGEVTAGVSFSAGTGSETNTQAEGHFGYKIEI